MNFTGKKIFTSEELKDLEKKIEDAVLDKLKAEVRYLIDEYLKHERSNPFDLTNGKNGVVITITSWNKCYEDYPDVQRMLSEIDVRPFYLEETCEGILVSYVPEEKPKKTPGLSRKPRYTHPRCIDDDELE